MIMRTEGETPPSVRVGRSISGATLAELSDEDVRVRHIFGASWECGSDNVGNCPLSGYPSSLPGQAAPIPNRGDPHAG